jgi:hypothetical protein
MINKTTREKILFLITFFGTLALLGALPAIIQIGHAMFAIIEDVPPVATFDYNSVPFGGLILTLSRVGLVCGGILLAIYLILTIRIYARNNPEKEYTIIRHGKVYARDYTAVHGDFVMSYKIKDIEKFGLDNLRVLRESEFEKQTDNICGKAFAEYRAIARTMSAKEITAKEDTISRRIENAVIALANKSGVTITCLGPSFSEIIRGNSNDCAECYVGHPLYL